MAENLTKTLQKTGCVVALDAYKEWFIVHEMDRGTHLCTICKRRSWAVLIRGINGHELDRAYYCFDHAENQLFGGKIST